MSPLRTSIGSAVAVAAVATSIGCAASMSGARLESAAVPHLSSTTVILHGTALDLHLARPADDDAGGKPLVLYASGDGGWFGAAVDMFRTIADAGYPAVGFSTRAFMKVQRAPHATLNARQLAADYATILAAARRALALPPGTRAVLAGWSRGAAFAAIGGSEPALRPDLRGVVAIGLAADEDLSIDGPQDETDDADASTAVADGAGGLRGVTLRPYDRLGLVRPLPCAVIQSTGDGYLPADQARHLFGPDQPDRRLYAVAASNHRFSGGRRQFGAALADALSWIASANTSSVGQTLPTR